MGHDSDPAHILLLEDDAGHVRVVERAFESSDAMTLAVAGTLAAARESIADRCPDLVIADLLLPDGRGIDLIRRDEPRDDTGDYALAEFPVIMMTSHGDEQVAVEAMRAGALDYIAKSSATLLDMPRVAERALREWRLRLENQRAERLLRESEQRIRNVLHAVPDLILVHNQQGRVLQCEGGSQVALPISRDELQSMELSDWLTPGSAEALREVFGQVLRDGSIETCLYEMRIGDETRIFEAHATQFGRNQILSILRDVTRQRQAAGELARLSDREEDVLQLVMEGLTNKAIASELGINIKTVEKHRSNLMKKLNARSIADLLRIAFAAQPERPPDESE